MIANNSMPISAQEWRVRTGMYNASKRVWLNPNTKTSYPTHSAKESTAQEVEPNSQGVWSVALATMLVPFLPRLYTVLICILKMSITSGGGGLHTTGCKLSDTNKRA